MSMGGAATAQQLLADGTLPVAMPVAGIGLFAWRCVLPLVAGDLCRWPASSATDVHHGQGRLGGCWPVLGDLLVLVALGATLWGLGGWLVGH